MQSKQIIELLENEPSKQFIERHLGQEIDPLRLEKSRKNEFNITLCLQLLAIYQKAQKKLPTFSAKLLALDSRSYQQASAELIAQFKTTFISGNKLLDLTAGLGVDGIALSKNFKTVELYDVNPDMVAFGNYNLAKLGVQNASFKLGNAEEHISAADWIYLDPDRRNSSGRKVALHLLSPNIIDLLPQLNNQAENVYLKLSPLFDLQEAYRTFDNIYQCFVLAENGEIKEVGIWLKRDSDTKTLVLHDIGNNYHLETLIESVENQSITKLEHPQRYFYTPNALLLKSGLHQLEAYRNNLNQIESFNYYTNDKSRKVKGFKLFEVLYSGNWNKGTIRDSLTERNIEQATIVFRGLKQNEDQWYKKLNIKKGGKPILFMLKGKKKLAVLVDPIF